MTNPESHEVEWKIKNFSCWCDAVHGKFIESSDFLFSPFKKAKLFPRGVSGQDDHMDVRFCNIITDFNCKLSFIDFEGSIIDSQQVKKSSVAGTGVNVPGPKFDEVIDNIRKADRKDEITLHFRMRGNRNYQKLMCSTINILKVSLKVDPKIIGIAKSQEGAVFFFSPSTSDSNNTSVSLKMATQCDNILLIMLPLSYKKPVLAYSYTTIVNGDGAIVKYEDNRHVFIDNKPWTFSKSMKKKELVENGNAILLRIKLINGEIVHNYNYLNYWKEVSVTPKNLCFSEPKLLESPAPSHQPDDSVTELAKELMCLYQDHDYSDFELKCDNVSFPVHRNILSARSPVFKSMLSCDMQEAATGCVDIVEMTPATLALFLAFLYTGSVEGMQDESALNLYYAADKYQVPSLKKKCVDYLSVNVSLSNVCDILTLADKYKDENLIAVSRNFILDNNSAVMESNEWERFMESEPKLALKTFTYFAQKKYVVKKS